MFLTYTQAATLILSLCISMNMIFSGLKDWNDHPVLMNIDTLENPLDKIEFPAITICQANDFQPDNWAMTEQVFNSFEFNCKPNDKFTGNSYEQHLKGKNV